MIKIICSRIFSNENKTLSNNYIVDGNTNAERLKYKGIELPWKQNQKGISCIPAGIYSAIAVKRYSNNRYALWVQDVPDRTQIMVHSANYARDLMGCLAPGRSFRDIDNDGIIDVTDSRLVMRDIESIIPLGTEIKYHVMDTYRVYGNEKVTL